MTSGDNPHDSAAPTLEEKHLTIDYIKSGFFRVVHADGAYGGITPVGLIEAFFWNNRLTIPKRIHCTLNADGSLTEEAVELRADTIREVEVAVLMDLATAKNFRSWIDDKINTLEAAIGALSAPMEKK